MWSQTPSEVFGWHFRIYSPVWLCPVVSYFSRWTDWSRSAHSPYVWVGLSFHHYPVLWAPETSDKPTSSGATLSQLETCIGEIKKIADAKLGKENCQIKRQQARAEEGSQSDESAERVRNFWRCHCRLKEGYWWEKRCIWYLHLILQIHSDVGEYEWAFLQCKKNEREEGIAPASICIFDGLNLPRVGQGLSLHTLYRDPCSLCWHPPHSLQARERRKSAKWSKKSKEKVKFKCERQRSGVPYSNICSEQLRNMLHAAFCNLFCLPLSSPPTDRISLLLHLTSSFSVSWWTSEAHYWV